MTNALSDGRYLYRGVNAELHQATGGRLAPKASGEKFERGVYLGEERYWGDGSVFGHSERKYPLGLGRLAELSGM
jgi:hypothetical protein